jgi:hypothetical protein
VSGIIVAFLGSSAGAQESLDRGKSPAQLFASHCSACHKSPRGLAKSGGLFGLDGFLREHYMTSRETAAAMSSYLRDSGPAPARASKRAARGDDNAKLNERKKPASKPGEARGAGSPRRPSPNPLISLRPNPDRRPGSRARPRQARQSPSKAPGSDKSNQRATRLRPLRSFSFWLLQA